MMKMQRLNADSDTFEQALIDLLAFDESFDEQVDLAVNDIIKAVINQGDQSLVGFTNQFDHRQVSSVSELQISEQALDAALFSISKMQRQALEVAAKRIQDYHQHQYQQSWSFVDDTGTRMGQKITPIERVGIYVPGGKASYPSSVLMNAIPAKVAGVTDIVMMVPAPYGELNDLVLAAARIAGVNRIFTIGGAQAIAALAFGTESVPKVDKIVGPGNIFVATAKQKVFGKVGLDMIAGPSEILIVCDGLTDPDWIALDLFSQAEHDENAQSILISEDSDFLDKVEGSIKRLLPTMQRASIISESLAKRGALIRVKDLDQAADICNRIAPEHLEVSIDDPEAFVAKIDHAGAIFMGRYTSEALGDYCAGPNHVLPTSATARFSSALGVYDFQKRSSLIHCTAESADRLGAIASVLARGESLEAHALSAEKRMKPGTDHH